uniref:Putative secreted protein n=1 Tax=Anopheles triannulatus TaxID=58253 RepID=A0A2M4B5P8_9DIPT
MASLASLVFLFLLSVGDKHPVLLSCWPDAGAASSVAAHTITANREQCNEGRKKKSEKSVTIERNASGCGWLFTVVRWLLD